MPIILTHHQRKQQVHSFLTHVVFLPLLIVVVVLLPCVMSEGATSVQVDTTNTTKKVAKVAKVATKPKDPTTPKKVVHPFHQPKANVVAVPLFSVANPNTTPLLPLPLPTPRPPSRSKRSKSKKGNSPTTTLFSVANPNTTPLLQQQGRQGYGKGINGYYKPTPRPVPRPTLVPRPVPVPVPVSVPTPVSVPLPLPLPLPTPRPPTMEASRPHSIDRYLDPLIEFLQDNQVYFDKNAPYSPPYLAVQWLAKEASGSGGSDSDGDVSVSSPYGNGLPTLDKKLLQRFAVLAIEFALNRPAPLIISDASVAKTIRVSTNDYTYYEKSYAIGVEMVDECEWEGVTCGSTTTLGGSVNNNSGTVVKELRFGSSRFTGTIPSEITLLQQLKILDLSNNQLQGPIPESLYSIKELHKLYLYQNQLTGTISKQITNWYNMTHLHLSHNELSGSIPLTFISGVNIRPIEYLNVYSNQLTGTLPNNFRFRKTVFADFGRNHFSGPLPDDIGQHWVKLRYLYLDHNTFTGTIPYSYPNTGNDRLAVLAVNHNHLTGQVPDNWKWSVRKLHALNLHNNSFSSIGYRTCKESVFNKGAMVEYSADCDVCQCSPFCDLKCGDGQKL